MGGMAFIAPISTGGGHERTKGFAVPLTGAGTATTGVVLCGQLRALDLKVRNGRFVEMVPGFVVDEVLDRLGTLLG